MCTAISFLSKDHYFGRNLDIEFSYVEQVTITPKKYVFPFRYEPEICTHHAMIGMAFIPDNYPLYYDAVNEAGLCMAGLSFEGNAVYRDLEPGMYNIAPFEFIPWVLSRCSTVSQVKTLLERTNLASCNFDTKLPSTALHWIICDKTASIVVEPLETGLTVHDDPVGVLTNNPAFPLQLFNLNNYMHLSSDPIKNNLCKGIDFDVYSRGMGAIGLPGDLSSQSRYIRAAFTKLNSICDGTESGSVSQFFHILGSAEQQRGCVRLEKECEITIYSSCCNTRTGVYYYKTYENNQLSAVAMHHENLNGSRLISYPLQKIQHINYQN